MPLPDTSIVVWADDFLTGDTNLPADGDNMDTPLDGGLLDDQVRNIMSVVRAEATNKMWERWGITPTYVSPTSFTMPADLRASPAISGRRVRAAVLAGYKYGTIMSSAYVAPNTIVTVQWDLEQYSRTFAVVDGDTIKFAGVNVTTDFPVGMIVEIWDPVWNTVQLSPRAIRTVSTVTFTPPDTVVAFVSGNPTIQIVPSMTVVMRPSAGIDSTLSGVAFGLLTPDLYQSGWPQSLIVGSTTVVMNAVVGTGPYAVALPERLPGTSYVVQLQGINAHGGSALGFSNAWAVPDTPTSFNIFLPPGIDPGVRILYDYVISRGQ